MLVVYLPFDVTEHHMAKDEEEDSGFYEAYAGFARALRTWFIAYGIGGPVIFLTNEAAAKILLASGAARTVAYCFLLGVALQIVTALSYKSAMWHLYMGELDPEKKSRRLYKASDWLTQQYWLEVILDIGTLGLFGWATLKTLNAFA